MKITIPYLQERIDRINRKQIYWGDETKLADLKKKLEYLQNEEKSQIPCSTPQ